MRRVNRTETRKKHRERTRCPPLRVNKWKDAIYRVGRDKDAPDLLKLGPLLLAHREPNKFPRNGGLNLYMYMRAKKSRPSLLGEKISNPTFSCRRWATSPWVGVPFGNREICGSVDLDSSWVQRWWLTAPPYSEVSCHSRFRSRCLECNRSLVEQIDEIRLHRTE